MLSKSLTLSAAFSPVLSVITFTDLQKQAITARHNALRQDLVDGKVPGVQAASAEDMLMLEWDENLAASAADWASKCDNRHDSAHLDTCGSNGCGENLAASANSEWVTNQPNEIDVINDHIQAWWDEHKDYTYGTLSGTDQCNGVCGHFTQAAWSRSSKIGCATNDACSTLDIFGSAQDMKVYYTVCRYDPPGNFMGQVPWEPNFDLPILEREEGNGTESEFSDGFDIGFEVSDSNFSNSTFPSSGCEVNNPPLPNDEENFYIRSRVYSRVAKFADDNEKFFLKYQKIDFYSFPEIATLG